MPKGHKEPTGDETQNSETSDGFLSRRRILQIGGVGVALGTLGTVTADPDGEDELSDTIIIDGRESTDPVFYEFLISGSVATHPDIGTNDTLENDDRSHVIDEIHSDLHAYRFSGELSYLDIDGSAEVRLIYGDDGEPETDRLEIVSSSDGEVDYEFIASDRVTKVLDNGTRSADTDDTVTETDDGTWVVDGSTRNGNGDTYDFEGDIERFDPVTGAFTLFYNGEETTVTDLTGQEVPEADDEEAAPDREHWYSFEATGDEYADYYLEVEEGGEMIASEVDDAVVETDLHWINDDGTKAAGRVQPGDTHAYAFDTLVADVSIEGDAHATVDGSDSNLEYYPREMAAGDHWKGYFPWQIDGEERTHWYSFEATGDEYADYYIEVEEGGETIPSLVDDAVIEYEYFWIGDEGTKAAGRVQPGDTHAYAFDTLVADVTVEGDVQATVDGSDSNLDGDYYPREMATGDYWKTGFPWQDDDHEAVNAGEGSVIGGGPGYANAVTSDQADYVVRTKDDLAGALSSASAGDVVFIDGDASIDMGSSSYTLSRGVTLASDRGVNGSEGALLATSREPTQLFVLRAGSRFTGLRVRGSSPGSSGGSSSLARALSVTGDDIEVDNCDIWGFPYAGIFFTGGDGHVHHNVIRECNKGGLGYGISMTSGNPVIEYNYFDFNRHSVATDGEHYGYVCRYNHFGPRITSHAIDMHDPAGVRYEVHNNVVEGYIDEDGRQQACVALRGVPDDVAMIEDNWFWNPDEPASSPDGWSTRRAIIQVGTSSWQGISFANNDYGSDANTSFADVIPGYDGNRS